MQTAHYNDATDFFAMFDEGDFDEQVQKGNTLEGYILVDNTRKLAAKFVFDNNSKTSGTGTWDDTLL